MALALVVSVLAGCAASPSAKPQGDPSPHPSSAGPTSANGTASATADAFAERDAFFAEQGFTGTAGPLSAKTDTQRALVAAQRAYTEEHGGVWTQRSESILLALASDACETGILSHHRIDGVLLKNLVVSSPITAQVIPKDATAEQAALYERNIASMSVFGASYLCPADKDAWTSAFQTVYAS